MFSPTVVVELLGPGGEFFSAPNLMHKVEQSRSRSQLLEARRAGKERRERTNFAQRDLSATE